MRQRLIRVVLTGAAVSLLSACSFFGSDNGYYQNDGPPVLGGSAANGASPKVEPFYKPSLRPYTVLGKRYVPMTADLPLVQEGIGSWYGKQFHGNKTSTGETYDMYAASAAHTTMPLPSYARVTNLENGKSIVVRVNDRGPFLHNRVIDLSYAAAKSLGYVEKGTARVRIERLTNDQIASGAWKDPSRTAATKVENVVQSTASNVSSVVTAPRSGWSTQIGSFSNAGNAAQFGAHAEAVLASSGRALRVRIVKDGNLYRVVVGEGMSVEAARSTAADVGARLGVGAFAVQK